MEAAKIIDRISTVLICVLITVSAVMCPTHDPHMRTAFASRGYSSDIPNIPGVARLLGIGVPLAH